MQFNEFTSEHIQEQIELLLYRIEILQDNIYVKIVSEKSVCKDRHRNIELDYKF